MNVDYPIPEALQGREFSIDFSHLFLFKNHAVGKFFLVSHLNSRPGNIPGFLLLILRETRAQPVRDFSMLLICSLPVHNPSYLLIILSPFATLGRNDSAPRIISPKCHPSILFLPRVLLRTYWSHGLKASWGQGIFFLSCFLLDALYVDQCLKWGHSH